MALELPWVAEGGTPCCCAEFTCEDPTRVPDYLWDHGADDALHSIPGEHCVPLLMSSNTFVNPHDGPAKLHICGFVDDKITVDGVELDAGCCIQPFYCEGVNVAHTFALELDVEAGQSTTLAYYDMYADGNGGLSYVRAKLYYVPQ